MNEQENKKIWFLHFLRGVAAVLVVIHYFFIQYWYANESLIQKFGYLPQKTNQDYLVFFNIADSLKDLHFNLGSFGVALFFLISGFVIPISLKKTRGGAFLINRIFRIFPTYIIGFSITFAMIYFYMLGAGITFPYHLNNYLSQILLVRDWFGSPSIDGVSWVLETEIKFYLLIWLIWAFRGLNQPKIIAFVTVMLCGINILLHNKYDFLLQNNIRIYQIVYVLTYSNIKLAFMFLGVCFYYYHTGEWSLRDFIVTTQVVFLSFVFSFMNGPESALTAEYAVSYSAALLVFINAYLLKDVLPYHKLVNFFADISYPLYAVFSVNGYIIMTILDGQFHANPYLAIAAALAFAILVAYLLHKFVEEPTNTLGKKITQTTFQPKETNGNVDSMKKYLIDIWAARYFWLHLARAELKYKFRRSRLGLLWTMINPLMLMLMITIIFGNLFDIPMTDFAPYVFSGLIVWEFVLGSAVGGCNSLLSSEAYIKQFRHPIVIYPLKNTLVQIATFLIAVQAMFLWTLVTDPTNLLLSIVTLPITVVCLFLLGWPIAILTSSINLKYRDFSQVLGLMMQLVWYMSPVFFKPDMFRAKQLVALLEYNPVTHILNLVRAPLLNGTLPSMLDFGYVFGITALFYILAIWRMSRAEKTLIYYF